MDNIRVILHLSMNNMRRWVSNPRYYVIAVLGSLWMHYIVGSLSSFTNTVSVDATPWIFPFLLVDKYTPMLIMLGAVFLFADAPFMNQSTPYESIRSGKRTWVKAQVLYVIVTAFIWIFLLFLISILCLFPNLKFAWDWGKVYNTLAQTNAGAQHSVLFPVSYSIIQAYTPVNAVLYSFLLIFLEVAFIGMLIFTVSILASRVIAMFSGFILAFMPSALAISGMPNYYYFTPTAWSSLNMFVPNNKYDYPSLSFCIFFLLVAIVILSAIAILFAPSRETKVMLPV